ncbi:hypothetical protein D047_0660A, partial [Vibrio parahaemolyticus VPTS-2010_2]
MQQSVRLPQSLIEN